MSALSDFIIRGRELGRGQTMAEYAIILATIAAISVALVQNAGTIVEALVTNVCSLF